MRILILRPGAIGDWLLTFPILTALRAKYKNVHITLVGNVAILPMAQVWGFADEVYDQNQFQWNELDSATIIAHPLLIKLLQQADLTICWMWFTNQDGEQVRQNLFAAGAKEVIVAHGYPHHIPSKHMLDYLAESIGIHSVSAENVPTIVPNENAFCLYNPPIIIHPGSSDVARRWLEASFAEVINHLLRQGHPILLLAGPAEGEILKKVRRHLSSTGQPGQLTILQNAPLLEVARRIQQCKCYVGNDSGITHLAALLGVPTIALFLPHFVPHTRPLGPMVEVIQNEPLEQLSVDRVLESILRYV